MGKFRVNGGEGVRVAEGKKDGKLKGKGEG